MKRGRRSRLDAKLSVISASDCLIKHPALLFHSLELRVREQTLS